ncbi:MAG: ribonuclease HI family protein [Chloroflexota bacterium]|nr:ribonuclease HI family protein [Chloroflexota bacterium]
MSAAAPGRRLLIYTDGAARGNPGPAGLGAILRDAESGAVVAELARFLGVRTNNYAEWTAVADALGEALRLGATHVDLRMDSELVARQISGRYRVKHPDLKPIHASVMGMLGRLEGYTVGHVPRELNKDADRLSNVAIDELR